MAAKQGSESAQSGDAAPAAPPVATTDAAADGDVTKGLAADSMIKNYVIGAVAASIVPIPVVDIAAVSALQLRMIQKLSELYGRPFSEDLVRSLIASLGGSIVGYGAGIMAMSLVKVVPGIGWMLGMVSVPVVAGAATYAVGKVFVKHYEEGGSMLDLNTDKLKEYYREQFEKGKALARAAAGRPATPAA